MTQERKAQDHREGSMTQERKVQDHRRGSMKTKARYRSTDHTFVICAYQESPHLEECIRSVTHQSVTCNVLMTTSTPNAWIRRMAWKHQIPLQVRIGGPQGIAEDWNFALSCASTPLVTIAHQDDVYGKHYTEEIVRAANRCPRPLILFTDYAELRGERTVTANRLLCVKRFMLAPLTVRPLWSSVAVRRAILALGSAICCPSVTLVRPNIEEPVFENNMKSNIDWQAWEKISVREGQFAYIARPMMKHRIHPQSETSRLLSQDGRKEEDLMMYRKFWPEKAARLIGHFYQAAEKSNASG